MIHFVRVGLLQQSHDGKWVFQGSGVKVEMRKFRRGKPAQNALLLAAERQADGAVNLVTLAD